MISSRQKRDIVKAFTHLFGTEPIYHIFAPGRINLIGEHTDYSDGFVLPVAINLGISMAVTPRDDSRILIHSLDFNEQLDFELTGFSNQDLGWVEYIKGVAWALNDQGYPLKGWQGILSGDIPIGAGLSSSAALELAAVEAFVISSDLSLNHKQKAEIGKLAESLWVGVNVGIMDQMISASGKAGHAVLIDCRTLNYDYVPMPDNIRLIVLDTMTRRKLSQSAYNRRHSEVNTASEILGVTALRDSKMALLLAKRDAMPPPLFRRARHVISENERVTTFSDALHNNDLKTIGKLLNQSHTSLRDDFEVSSKDLDCIVDLAQQHPDCLGARMTGAGFGGCALALLDADITEHFIDDVKSKYSNLTGIQPHIFEVSSEDGVMSNKL